MRFKNQYSKIIEGFPVNKYADNTELCEVCELVGFELGLGDVEEGDTGGVPEESSEGEEDDDEEDQLLPSSPEPDGDQSLR